MLRSITLLSLMGLAGCHERAALLVSSTASEVAVSAAQVVADGTATVTVTVRVKTAAGAPVPGATVDLQVTGGAATLAPASGVADAQGVFVSSLSATLAGVFTITATITYGGRTTVLAATPTVTFVGDASSIDASLSSVTVSVASGVVANGADASTITVVVRDTHGNAVTGVGVTVTASGAGNTIQLGAPVTDQSGTLTATIASTVAGAKTITVDVQNASGGTVRLADQPVVEFVGDPDGIDPANSSVTASPATKVPADGTTTSTITVTVRDRNGNAVSGQTVQLAATGTGNTLVQPSAPTDAQGRAIGTLASTDFGTKTVTATVNPSGAAVVVDQKPTVEFVGDGLAAGDARAFYGEGAVGAPRYRDYAAASGSWSAEASAASAGAALEWIAAAAAPNGYEHLVAAFSDQGTGTELDMLRWTGTGWTVDWTATAITSANSIYRGFDVAYERSSGHALAVYSVDSANPAFRAWNGAAWSAESSVYGTPPGASTIVSVRMASRPGTDEIAVALGDAAGRYWLVVWNGAAFAAPQVISDTPWAADGNSLDLAYEQATGDLLVVHRHPAGGGNKGTQYHTMAAGSGTLSGPTTFTTSNGDVVRLAPEPAGSRIAVIWYYAGSTDDVGVAMWNGTAMTDVTPKLDDSPNTNPANTHDMVAVGWVGTSGVAVAVWADADSGAVDWGRWTLAGGWSAQVDVPFAGKGQTRSVRIVPVGPGNRLLALFSDYDDELWAARYDGAAWVVGGTALETQLSSASTVPFTLVQAGDG